jgi:hypothetical protein
MEAKTAQTIQKVCRPIRIAVGLALIAAGLVTGIVWFYLGILPLVAGLINFCPTCIITKKCEVELKEENSETPVS